MNSNTSIKNICTPEIYHREYANDVGSPDALKAWVDQSSLERLQRVTTVALPFIALYKPLSQPLSLALGGMRTVGSLVGLAVAIRDGGSAANVSYAALQTAIAIISVAGTIFAHPLGMLITTGQDLIIDVTQLAQYVKEGEYTKAAETCASILNNSLYLACFLHGGLEIAIASLGMQILLGAYHAQTEFLAGRCLEAAGHIGMVMIRGHQMSQQIEMLRVQNKLNALIIIVKKECKDKQNHLPNQCTHTKTADTTELQAQQEQPVKSKIEKDIHESQTSKVTALSCAIIRESSIQNDPAEAQELSEILLKYAPINKTLGKTIWNASKDGNERAVRLLIKYNVDSAADKSITLTKAIESRSLPLVKYLVEDEKYVSNKELYTAIMYDFFDGFDYFLSKGYLMPKDIIAQSIWGYEKYHLDLFGVGPDMARVNFLISRGADLSEIKNAPWTLNLAMRGDNLELMKFLLQNKAYEKINEIDWKAHPLHWAISGTYLSLSENRRIEYALLLANSGMKMEAKLAQNIWEDLFQFQRDRGIFISPQKSALIKAALTAGLPFREGIYSPEGVLTRLITFYRDHEIIEMVLKMGADPNVKIYLESPMQLAIKFKEQKIVALLIQYGAKLEDI